MSTITEQYSAFAEQATSATEKSVEAWKKNTQSFLDQTGALTQLPSFDLAPALQRYFDFVQSAVDANREFAAKFAEALTSVSGVVLEQMQTVGQIVQQQTDVFVDTASKIGAAKDAVIDHVEAA